jgi:hypothetical protein
MKKAILQYMLYVTPYYLFAHGWAKNQQQR